MKKCNKNKTLFLFRKAFFKNQLNDFCMDYVSHNYFLNKSSFLFNKYFSSFFRIFFFFFKKISILVKSLFFFKIFKFFFLYKIKKYVFSNFNKFLSNYYANIEDSNFFFFRKKELIYTNKIYFYKLFFLKTLKGNNYYSDTFFKIPEYGDNIGNFFYKGSIFSSFLEEDLSLTTLNFLNFDLLNINQCTYMYTLEVYKIYIYICIYKVLNNLYF